MTCHQYRISTLVPRMSFGEETSGSVAKCRLFSQANRLGQGDVFKHELWNFTVQILTTLTTSIVAINRIKRWQT